MLGEETFCNGSTHHLSSLTAGVSLVCNTSAVNSNCCVGQHDQMCSSGVGWLFLNDTPVPDLCEMRNRNYYMVRQSERITLNTTSLSAGTYCCKVPGGNGLNVSTVITLLDDG